MDQVAHPHNWLAGWLLLLGGFVAGAGIGLFFHREDFWGGYTSYRRRIVRLGHVAMAALGLTNVIFSLSPWPAPGSATTRVASACFIMGGMLMPMVCFLSGWKKPLRHLFVIPVTLLILAVVLTLLGGEDS